MYVRTKIICTIGPSCETYEGIVALIKAGMNVARLNFSHGNHEKHLIKINLLKQARKDLGVPLAIMLDTKGPEVRIGQLKNNEVSFVKGDKWKLVKDVIEGDKEKVTITPASILNAISLGDSILFNDGYISSRVIEKSELGVTVEIDNNGILLSGKGVNIPHVKLNLPPVTERDVEDIKFGCANDIDLIAASFIRSPDNIITIKNLLAEFSRKDIRVIAKIENHEGIENFDSILQVADGVMIARGDLGVEIPLSQVPRLQKEMIKKSYLAAKPSVTATQMLESMIYNPRPTRAEVSDVANAIYDSTTSVMLSGETAVGKYPVQTVEMMKSVIVESEADIDYKALFEAHSALVYNDVPSAVTLAAVKTAYSANAKAIFVFTSTGGTARLISRLRPKMPILAMTSNERAYHQMAINWGIIPILADESKDLKGAFAKMSQYALEKGFVSYGDLVIVAAGSTFGVTGTTNMMIVENIGDVLVRGHVGVGEKIYGNVKILLSSEESSEPYSVRGKLLVMTHCDQAFVPFMEEAAGLILQNHVNDQASEELVMNIAKKLGKPAIVRADTASIILKEGQLVTLDPEKALIYKGVVL